MTFVVPTFIGGKSKLGFHRQMLCEARAVGVGGGD